MDRYTIRLVGLGGWRNCKIRRLVNLIMSRTVRLERTHARQGLNRARDFRDCLQYPGQRARLQRYVRTNGFYLRTSRFLNRVL